MKVDRFVLAIIVTIIIAYFIPDLAKEDSRIPLDGIASIGIAIIFFFYGLKLKIQQIKLGLSNWKLHVLVQAATFLIFPLLILIFYPLLVQLGQYNIWLSFLFLAAVPSTVSSSVVMVSMAKGNIPAAIFNASLSGIIGIIITPLWMAPFLEQSSLPFDYSSIYAQLLIEILLPLALGLILQKWGHGWAVRNGKSLNVFDKSIILLIIYKSFAHSFINDLFATISWTVFAFLFVGVLVIFFVMFYLLKWITNLLHFDREDAITAQFCGTKKSLVHGTVFAKVLFSGTTILGLIILPLMIFHAIQIFIISMIAARYARTVTQQ